jgi:hypothetical protein
MLKRSRLAGVAVLAIALAALACNAGTAGSVPPTGEAPTPTQDSPATPATPTQPGPDTGLPARSEVTCPQAGEGTLAYESPDNGFCLLYPASYNRLITGDGAEFYSPPLDPSSMEPVVVGLAVSYTGPADGLDAAGYFGKWVEVTMRGFTGDFQPQDSSAGGYPAVVARGLAGRFSSMGAFVVAGGHKFRVTVSPAPGEISDLDAEIASTFQTALSSIVFFEPGTPRQVTRPEEVCPSESQDTQLHISLAEGYCFLYPAIFSRDETFESGFVGLTSATIEGWGEMPSGLVFSFFGDAQGQTPGEILEPWFETGIDRTTVTERTIGGAPAVVFIDTRGPVISRQAIIVANGRSYTIVNQPYYPEQFPEVTAEVNQVWDSVTGSVIFFEPWR